MADPIPIPMLNILPPSSDNDSWSPSPSPLSRRRRNWDAIGKKRRTRAQQEDNLGDGDRTRSKKNEKMKGKNHSPVSVEGEGLVKELANNSASFLLPPSRCSSPCTRSSRWSLRSFLLKDSDCESCSTASNSPRSTPGSSPSLRRRVLGGRASEGEGQNERTGGGGADSSSLPTASSSSSLLPTPSASTSNYPISSRHFTRNAKKMQSWYNVLSPTYKQRNEEFRKLFKKLPETERLIVDYSCALQKDILLQGRLYLSENWICFYSNIFRWETTITILLKDVTNLSKEKTAKLIPNAIQINTEQDKHFFTSFGARDRSFLMIFKLWQNVLMDKTLSPKELWYIVHQCYGTELGLTSEDDDYVSPTSEHVNGLLPADDSSSDVMDPSSASAAPGSSPLSSSSSSIQPAEVQPSKQNAESEPTPNTHSITHATPPASITAAATNLEEGGQDGQTEETEQVAPVAHVSSLEMTNDEELPTDPSNSSDTQEESEVELFCGDLRGRLHINTVVRMSVDRLYELLFSDTHFLQHLFTQRSFTDLSVQEWQKDSSSGISTRVLSYTIAINNPLGPKTAPVVETQTLHKSSSRGVCYVVDSEVITSGIPYQDYFYTVHRYCLTSVSTQKSRLRVSSDICYRKQPWSLVKALIEKNTWSGIEEYYRHMEMEVCKLETLLQSQVVCVGESELVKAPPTLRRRKHTGLKRAEGAGTGGGATEQGAAAQRERRDTGAQYLKVGERWRGSANNNSVTLLLIISFILVVLVALNMMLFYKLWALERAAHTLETWQSYSLSDSPLPQSSSEWMKVLQLQRQFHQAQLNKWQQILHSSVTLLDQMKQSLENLHRGIIRSEEQKAVAPPPSEPPTTDTLTEQ
ncbi:protein Aster-A isoform X1 [Tachysurus vachellii]|uniref:protein Aster-A isoform X1 n=1 Tax=Tachysurus vachellii TaxID=175792 RepID=UPI00296A928A|nr:protein Aster-A isoform X1 [Tachysurus vachellii]XP_060717435.1 protein Aster-A isoform X1 [Tachysurus vachellii]